jgi:hypothetical protein
MSYRASILFLYFLTVFVLVACTQAIKLGQPTKERPPTVDMRAIGNQVLQEDSDQLSIPFKIEGRNTEPEKMIFQTSSSDPTVLKNPRIDFDTETGEYLLILEPEQDKWGEVKALIRANNGIEDQRKEISVTVESVNDLPVVYAPAEIKLTVGELKKNELTFNIHDVETPTAELKTRLELTQQALFPEGTFEFDTTKTGRNRRILFKKPPQSPGNGFLKIFAEDKDGGVGLYAVHVVVERAPNQSPILLGVPNQIRVGSGQKSVEISLTFEDDTSTPEGLSFSAITKNPELLPQKNILISGNGLKRSVTIDAPKESKGNIEVLFELTDGKSKTTQKMNLEIY